MQNTDIDNDNDIEYDNDIEMKRGVWGEKQKKNGLLKRLFQ
ncbi:hypothetical protein [Flavobacterium beibuense]|nr:hypothetical protein [Flavobacterium beibuense]